MKFTRVGLLLGLGLTSGAVFAQTPGGFCDSVLSSYQSAVSSGSSSSASQIVSNHPECFPGSSTSAQAQISGTSYQQMTTISRQLGLRFFSDNPGPVAAGTSIGMSAGNAGKKWNMWGSADNNVMSQSYRAANNFVTTSDSSVLNMVFGVDYSLSPKMVVGASFAVDRGRTGGVNTAPGSVKNAIDTDGFAFAPYIGYQISKAWFFDGSIGLGKGYMASSTLTEGESTRWFGAANLGYEHWVGNFQLSGKGSYLRAVENHDDLNIRAVPGTVPGTAARNTLGQLRLTAQAGYWANGYMPYASLAYINDIERKTTQFGATIDPIGRHAWAWTLGVNFISLSSGLTGGLAYRREEGRTNQDTYTVLANIAMRF